MSFNKKYGKYNRVSMKEKKGKRFVNVKMILELIYEHKHKFEEISPSIMQMEKRDIDWGDEWDSEHGYEYLIFFSDKSAYLVGETTLIEDRENYAQAESWQQTHCLDYYEKRRVACLELIEKLEKLIY